MDNKTRYIPEKILLPDGRLHTGLTISVGADGRIIEMNAATDSKEGIRLDGILSPGFINGHCHLELSGLKGVIPEGTGLGGFIKEIVPARNKLQSDQETIKAFDSKMWNSGTQGAGDICNTSDTIRTKCASSVRYHSFIEIFDLSADRTGQALEKGYMLSEQFNEAGLANSLAPHAPYTVTPSLHLKIIERNRDMITTMHFMEDSSERQFINDHTGELFDTMTEMGAKYEWLWESETSGIRMLDTLWKSGGMKILVHNTYLEQDDIDHIKRAADVSQVWFCLCPNANQYIEGRLPNIDLLARNKLNLMIGTDSLASNHQLSVISEVNTILRNFPHIDPGVVLSWATKNGADAYGWKDLGRFQGGCVPGGVLIKGEPGNYIAERVF